MRSFWKRAKGAGLPLCLTLCLTGGLPPSLAQAGTELVSASATGELGNGYSYIAALSADGLSVALISYATNLAPGIQTKFGSGDLFVKRLVTGKVLRLNVSAGGEPSEGKGSSHVALSADGLIIAFDSYEQNLVAGDGDTNNAEDVFVKDLVTGAVRRISISATGEPGNGASFQPSLSADGKTIAFSSNATNLAPGLSNGYYQVYVKDLTTGAVRRVSVSATGEPGNRGSLNPSLSADGRRVAFSTYADNLVDGDTIDQEDVFVADLTTGRVQIASAADGVHGNGSSFNPSLSADGKIVAFASDATNLAPGISNGKYQIYVKDLTTGAIQCVSVFSSGVTPKTDCRELSLSADGKRVAFSCPYNTLQEEVYLKDLASGALRIASVSSSGDLGNKRSFSPFLDAHGRVVAFNSDASNLAPGDTNNDSDAFVAAPWLGNRVTVQLPGPPVVTGLEVIPDGPYAPGDTVTVVADVSSALPLTKVVVHWGDSQPVDLTPDGSRWTGRFTFPPTTSPQSSVKVVANDTQGRRAIRGRLLTILQAPPPPNTDWVFLIPGFGRLEPGPQPWQWDTFYRTLKSRLNCPDEGSEAAECDGTKVPGFQPTVRVLKVDGTDPNAAHEANAAALAAFVHGQPLHKGDRIFLIGHDTGGIIGRVYLNRFRNDALYGSDVAKVARLVQTGAPNGGTPIATAAAAYTLLDPDVAVDTARNMPALYDTAEPGAAWLNLRYDHGADVVPFSFVTGECESLTCRGSYAGMYLYMWPVPSDGFVPVSSAQAIATARDYVHPVLTGTDHGALINSRAGWDALITALFATAPGDISHPTVPLQAGPLQVATQPKALFTSVRHIPAGKSLTVPLHFEGEKLVAIHAIFLGSGAEATLNGPAGTVLPLHQFASSAFWFIPAPSAGEYSLILKGMGVNGRPTDALITAGSLTATPFAGQVTPPLVAARPVTLRAVLTPGSYQPAATDVTAKVALAGGTLAPVAVKLRDDGIAPDDAADDGTFTGVYQPAGAGRYSVEFTFKGKTADGRNLDRATASYFEDRWRVGDVNGDLVLNVGDVVLTLRIAVGLMTGDALQRGAADVNGDGQVTVRDAVLSLRRVLFGAS